MKKFYASFLLLIILLTGCTSSITESYPDIAHDFTKDDYKQLEQLSNKGELSYEELCDQFIKTNINTSTVNMINNLSQIGQLSDVKCKKDKDNFTFSYKLSFDKGDTVMTFTTNATDYSLQNIQFSNTNLKYVPLNNIIECFGYDKRKASAIYSRIRNERHIKHKIYVLEDSFYFLPIKDNQIRMYTSRDQFDKSYVSSATYWDRQLKENDREIQKLRDDLKKNFGM